MGVVLPVVWVVVMFPVVMLVGVTFINLSSALTGPPGRRVGTHS